jgi:hypothetical protein
MFSATVHIVKGRTRGRKTLLTTKKASLPLREPNIDEDEKALDDLMDF